MKFTCLVLVVCYKVKIMQLQTMYIYSKWHKTPHNYAEDDAENRRRTRAQNLRDRTSTSVSLHFYPTHIIVTSLSYTTAHTSSRLVINLMA